MSYSKERSITLYGADNIDYLISVLEKAYFETKEPKHKKFLANLLSRLA